MEERRPLEPGRSGIAPYEPVKIRPDFSDRVRGEGRRATWRSPLSPHPSPLGCSENLFQILHRLKGVFEDCALPVVPEGGPAAGFDLRKNLSQNSALIHPAQGPDRIRLLPE